MAAPAGYSGTPLPRKLGIKPGAEIVALGAPPHYPSLLAPLPEGTRLSAELGEGAAFVHVFVTQEELAPLLPRIRALIAPDGALWVSWPKRTSPLSRGLSEDPIRALALAAGWVDVKVCAVDADWSGLKLVVPVKDRPGRGRG